MNDEEQGRARDGSKPDAVNGKPAARSGSFAATMKAVLWSFFGVRKRSGYESDAANLNPVHVIIAGVIAAAVFIGILVTIVRWVVAK